MGKTFESPEDAAWWFIATMEKRTREIKAERERAERERAKTEYLERKAKHALGSSERLRNRANQLLQKVKKGSGQI